LGDLNYKYAKVAELQQYSTFDEVLCPNPQSWTTKEIQASPTWVSKTFILQPIRGAQNLQPTTLSPSTHKKYELHKKAYLYKIDLIQVLWILEGVLSVKDFDTYLQTIQTIKLSP